MVPQGLFFFAHFYYPINIKRSNPTIIYIASFTRTEPNLCPEINTRTGSSGSHRLIDCDSAQKSNEEFAFAHGLFLQFGGLYGMMKWWNRYPNVGTDSI